MSCDCHDGGAREPPQTPRELAGGVDHDGGAREPPQTPRDLAGGVDHDGGGRGPGRRVDRRFVPLALLCIAGWWGCAKGDAGQASIGSGGSGGSSSSSSAGGSVGTGGTGGTGGGHDAGVCAPTSVPATHVPLDIVFTIDQSSAMQGGNWSAVTQALPTFFMDPASAGVGAGEVLFPYSADDCDLNHYKALTVPVGVLPANATALTSAFPASAVGVGSPMYPALQGALMQATTLKDAQPTHTVFAVLATNGLPGVCDTDIDDLATLAASALSYNGVLTHVVALPGATVYDLNLVAASGGTVAVHDLTSDVGSLAATLAEIRTAGLGCDFTIPNPPNNHPLDPNEVNLSYTPMGMGAPIILLRATDAAGCSGQPGWYYDDAGAPTKIVLCPASCATVQADTSAEVDVLFDCKSQLE
jgi:hypothetical protein